MRFNKILTAVLTAGLVLSSSSAVFAEANDVELQNLQTTIQQSEASGSGTAGSAASGTNVSGNRTAGGAASGTDESGSGTAEGTSSGPSASENSSNLSAENSGETEYGLQSDENSGDTESDLQTDEDAVMEAADSEDVQVSITDIAGDEKAFQILLTGIGTDSASYVAAVWSAENGQDDLRWNSMTKNADGSASVTIRIQDYKSNGEYYIHIYKNDGAMHLVSMQSLNISPVSAAGISTEAADQSKGTCRVRISGVACPSGVTTVQVPVWCSSDQSDIRWYTAKKDTDGSWYADISIANHAYHSGTYQIHAYGTSGNGFRNYIGQTQIDFEGIQPQVETSVGTGTVSVKASGLVLSEKIQSVTVAVWSAENGQDDLKWTSLDWDPDTCTAAGTVYPADYKHLGLCYAHVYARGISGKMYLMGQTSFKLEVTGGTITVGTIQNEKNIPVTISGVSSPYAFSKVLMAVWSEKNDQDDLIWYDMSGNNGSYSASADLSRHKTLGQYQVHVYGVAPSGAYILLSTSTFSVNAPAETTITTSGEDSTGAGGLSDGTFQVSISLDDSTFVKSVTVPVWCAEDQSDICWYSASKQADGTYAVTVDMAKHQNHTGKYKIHVYATLFDGSFTFMGNTDTTFAPEKYMTISSSSGKRTVTYYTSEQLSDARVAVWSEENGQDDLTWLSMTKSGSAWTVTIDGSDFDTTGTYYVHIYTGTSTFLGAGSFSFSSSEVNSAWVWPCPSSRYISSYFGNRESPTAGASSYHQGLDIAASSGSSIVAVAAGTVTDKGYDSVRGYYVFVTLNNGIVTLSQHMCQSAIVSVGQKVSAGQVIGYVGSTGVATGAHLHFSVIVNGTYVDPLPYLANS